MKFKTGDLVIIRDENQEYNGRIAEIVRKAPYESFTLPDGYKHIKPSVGGWIIRLYGDPVTVPAYTEDEPSAKRITRYGVGGGTKMEKIGNVDEIILAWVAKQGAG
jgi:hypothetical protein